MPKVYTVVKAQEEMAETRQAWLQALQPLKEKITIAIVRSRSHHIMSLATDGHEVHIERFTVQEDSLTIKFGYAAWIFLHEKVVGTHPITELEPLLLWLRDMKLEKASFQAV